MGHGPMEISGNLQGALKEDMSLPITTPFQTQKMTGIQRRQTALCASIRWPPGYINRHSGSTTMQRWVEPRHIPLAPSETPNVNPNSSDCQQERLLMTLQQISQWAGPARSWHQTDAGSRRGLQIGPDKNRHLLLTLDYIFGGRCKHPECYRRAETEDTAPIWISNCHFFKTGNIIYSIISNNEQRYPLRSNSVIKKWTVSMCSQST